MRKLAPKIAIGIAVAAPLIALFSAPLQKWPTKMAISQIEQNYLRGDLKDEEKEQLQFNIRWIKGNEARAQNAYQLSATLVFILSAALVWQTVRGANKENQDRNEK